MIIAVDIDEVIADTLSAFLLHYNQKFNTTISSEEFHTSDWGEKLNLNSIDLNIEIGDFTRSPQYSSLKPVKGAVEALTDISKTHILYAVTSRWGELAKTTESWIANYLPNTFKQIFFSSTSHINPLQNSFKKKSHICKEINAKIIIEDCPRHAADCASNNINVILFSRPWNTQFKLDGVVKAYTWKEISMLIHKLS